MEDQLTYFFLIFLGLVLIIVDVAVTGVTMLFPFGIGLLVFGVAVFYVDFWIAVVLSIVVTILSFVWAYYFSRSSDIQKHIVLDVIGKKGKIINKTKDGDHYVAVIGTEDWLADSEEQLKVGDKVFVEKIEGVKVIVKKLKE